MVIDVQDGYDGEFISSLPDDTPGSLGFIKAPHDVRRSVELVSKAVVKRFAPGEKSIKLDKVWNRGLDGECFGRVTDRVVKEIREGDYEFVCFTYDYLEKSTGEEKGVFALDQAPWSDPKKAVALVPYSKYLTINAGGLGTDVSRRIRDALPEPKAQTLIEKLTARGFGPDEAVLHFVGVVTNRCVASTLLHGVSLGYEAVLLEGGCCAADDHEQHADGVKNIREKGGEAVEVRP